MSIFLYLIRPDFHCEPVQKISDRLGKGRKLGVLRGRRGWDWVAGCQVFSEEDRKEMEAAPASGMV